MGRKSPGLRPSPGRTRVRRIGARGRGQGRGTGTAKGEGIGPKTRIEKGRKIDRGIDPGVKTDPGLKTELVANVKKIDLVTDLEKVTGPGIVRGNGGKIVLETGVGPKTETANEGRTGLGPV